MAASINASTSSGLLFSSDMSGQLALQSNGTTVATATPSGLSFPTGSTINTSNTFGMKNRLINGAMTISQRGTSFSVSSLVYTLDRFGVGSTGGGVITVTQDTTAPAGFNNSLKAVVATADASIAASDEYVIYQPIEGYNLADFGFGTANATSFNLSFWVQSSIAGTYAGALYTSTRAYIFTYTINVANTFEQKTVTAVADTSGTYNSTNGVGVIIGFDLGSGSNFNGTASTWQSGSYLHRTSGSTNWISTVGASFYVTGIQFEKGSQATSFDFRDIGREQLLCYRYYYQSLPLNSSGTAAVGILLMGGTESTSICAIGCILPVTMRTAPSFTLANANIYTFTQNIGPANITLNTNRCSASHAGASMNNTASGWTGGQPAYAYNSGTNSYFAVSAEL